MVEVHDREFRQMENMPGMFTKGGALEVGIASTSAVTNSCIGILCADFVLTKLLVQLTTAIYCSNTQTHL